MSDDPDKTDPNLQRYLRADGWLDRHLAPLVASPLTLAVLAASHLAAFVLGVWAGW